MEQVKIFDATLYGGGQSPGVGLNLEEKLEIARLLEQMEGACSSSLNRLAAKANTDLPASASPSG